MPYVNKPRPYKKEYEQYQGTEEQKKNRASRNAARREMMKLGKARKGDGMDVEHVTPLSKGGKSTASNLRMEKQHDNRSFYRNPDSSVKVNKSRTKKK